MKDHQKSRDRNLIQSRRNILYFLRDSYLSILFIFAFSSSSSQGQVAGAASDVVGVVSTEVRPGIWAEIAPIFFPPSTAAGAILAETSGEDSRSASAKWTRSMDPWPDPLTSFIFPWSGNLAGIPLQASRPGSVTLNEYNFWDGPWNYGREDKTGLDGKYLAAGNKLVLTPFYLIEEITGSAALWEIGTEFNFGSVTANVISSAEAGKVWSSGSLNGPGLVVDNAWGPYRVKRPLDAINDMNVLLVGTFRRGAVNREFKIRPDQTTTVFRTDGIASQPLLYLNGKLNIGIATPPTITPAANLTATAVTNADKIHLLNRTTGQEETWIFKKAQTSPASAAGWFRIEGGQPPTRISEIEVAGTNLPAGASFKISRTRVSSTTPMTSFRLPLPTNSITAPTLAVPITSYDKDRLPDFWEEFYFPGSPAKTVAVAADPDQDGFNNLDEWLLGGNPAVHDHPGLLEVVPTSTNGKVTSLSLSFRAAAGMKFVIETKLADAAGWSPAVTGIFGIGEKTTYAFPVPPQELTSLSARFFRVVGLGPRDKDNDGLFDVEEWHLGSDIDLVDTDGDDMSDSIEMKTKGRNLLDFWDNAIFSFVVTGDRQFGSPGNWCRDPVKISITRTLPVAPTTKIPLPTNLSVSFIMTRGSANFGSGPDADPASIKPYLTQKIALSSDGKTGQAICHVRFGAVQANRLSNGNGSSPIQGLVSVRVDSDPLNSKLYNESFCLYPSEYLTPPAGLVTWLRAERQVTKNSSGKVIQWGPENLSAKTLTGGSGPSVAADAKGRSWLKFTGVESLLLDDIRTVGSAYSLFVNAKGGESRAVPPATLSSNAGAKGQYYVISGALPAGTPNLPTPYSDANYRSFGISLGTASAGLFDIGSSPLTDSPWITPSSACTGNGAAGVLLGLVTPVDSAPLFRVTGRSGVVAAWQNEPVAPHYLPRMIGGRAGGALANSGNGMFVGELRDILLFDRNLTSTEAQCVEDIITSEKAIFTKAYAAIAPGINRDPGTTSIPKVPDTMPDWWERSYFGNLTLGFDADDPDGDGLSSITEYTKGTHPRMRDTDGDGLTDAQEINGWKFPGSTAVNKTSPVSWDSDNDLLPDNLDKLPLQSSNGFANTDGAGVADGWDWLIGNVGTGTDSDGDGLSDLFEVAWLGTDPLTANVQDLDGDGIADWWEVIHFSDLDPTYDPDATSSYNDGDGISDLEEFLLGLDPRKNEFGNPGNGQLQIENVIMDDQGRVKAVGGQQWEYDAEGNVKAKN